MSEMEKRVG
jgi:phenylalanyl-tRNA synthetase alpha chain